MAVNQVEQLRLAAQLIQDGNWDELNTLFASSPKSTDSDAQEILSVKDEQQALELLATWNRQVQVDALGRSNFGKLVK